MSDATISLRPFCLLLIVFAGKHFVADFVLQTNWIARGKERATGWAGPLAVHIGIHAIFTLVIVLLIKPQLWWLSLVDLVIHGLIDRSKSVVASQAQWPMTEAKFWWLLGFDQFLHQVTNIGLAYAIVVL